MSKDKTYDAFVGLPSWAKGVIAVVLTGGVAFAVWKGYEYFQDQKASRESNAVANSAYEMYKSLLKKGQKLSYPDSSYLSTANTILHLLDGCETTNSESQVVEEVAKVVKKPIDWYRLVSDFGSKDVGDCISFSKTNYELIGLLKEQLDYKPTGSVVLGELRFFETNLEILSAYLAKIGIHI